MKRFTLFAATTLLLALSVTAGCSLLSDSGKQHALPVRESNAPLSQPILEKTTTGIEVTWEIPSEPVDGFVIRYGEDKAKMTKEATILRSELREEQDPQYGPVYRYVLRDISSESPVYVSVAAFKGDIISDFSDAIVETQNAS
jgi:hypothetical protein